MKSKILIALLISIVLILHAQQTVNLFKSNLSVSNMNTANIDSVKFGGNYMLFDIYRNNSIELSIDILNIDSITFSDGIPTNLPALNNPEISGVLNTTAVCRFTINSTGGTSVIEKGICWSLNENPTINDNKVVSTSLIANSEINLSGLSTQTSYFIRAYAINNTGINYSNQVQFTTNNFTTPTVKTISATYNASTNKINCVVNISSNGGCALTERGICWSTKSNPTIADSKFSSGITVGQFYGLISDVNINNKYYIRGYATNCIGTTYGEEMTVQVLMGNVTYTLAQSVIDAGERTYKLIKTAMDSACYYYNRYTPFRNNIWVYYSSGIPTAQASYHGSIGFGSNERYMFVGTAMHEMAHYFGSGTTTVWKNLMVGGLWQGAVGKALCLQLTGESLKGDNNSNPQHYWPTGINQREEVKSQTDLINHAKIVKAMLIDDAKLPASW